MTNSYKILGQERPEDDNRTLYTPSDPNTSAVLSSIVVANTTSDDRFFNIYAHMPVTLGSVWNGNATAKYFSSDFGSDKVFFVKTETELWSFSEYAYSSSFAHKSTDGGITWQNQSKSANLNDIYSPMYSIKYINEKFVMITTDGDFLTSIDGINWTDRQQNLFSLGTLSKVISTKNKIIAISTEKEVVESSNGTSWSATTSNIGTFFTDERIQGVLSYQDDNDYIVVGSDVFSIFKNESNTISKLLKTSDDGVTWTDTGIFSIYNDPGYGDDLPILQNIYYKNNNIFVTDSGFYGGVTTVYGKIAKSSNLGVSWALLDPVSTAPQTGGEGMGMGGTPRVTSIDYSNGLYYIKVIRSEGSFFFTSEDLATFDLLNIRSAPSFTNGDFYIIESDRIILTALRNNSIQVSTKFSLADDHTVMFNSVLLPGNSTTAITLGISLGYGDMISVGSPFSSSTNLTYTAFGSEVTE
jgi:photosystem II stability/assembly factor-like uncharacterized protein